MVCRQRSVVLHNVKVNDVNTVFGSDLLCPGCEDPISEVGGLIILGGSVAVVGWLLTTLNRHRLVTLCLRPIRFSPLLCLI